MGQERPPIFFYAFDLLQLNGRDLWTLAKKKEVEVVSKLSGLLD